MLKEFINDIHLRLNNISKKKNIYLNFYLYENFEYI